MPQSHNDYPFDEHENSANTNGAPDETTQEDLKHQMRQELDELIARIRAISPDYQPPPFSPRNLIRFIEENIARLAPDMQLGILDRLRQTLSEDIFDIDTWKGIWYMLNYSAQNRIDLLKRRMSGEYETDPWGLDQEFVDAIRPFFEFMYSVYWRVETTGMQNIPDEGRALLVVNHSGQLPWDGSMVGLAILKEHPSQRYLRILYADWFPTLPFVSAGLEKLGQVMANEENGIRLLQQDELVAVFPEGTTSDGRGLKRFLSSLLQPAVELGCPILPAALRYRTLDGSYSAAPVYVDDISLWASVMRIVSEPGLIAELHFAAPLTPDSHRRDLAARAENAVADLLGISPADSSGINPDAAAADTPPQRPVDPPAVQP